MIRWFLWLALLCAGCSGLSSQAARYLKDSAPYQQRLSSHQSQLRQVSQLPLEQRQARAEQVLAEVRQDKQRLQTLKPPASVASVHGELEALYAILEQYIQATMSAGSNGLPGEPKLQRLSQEWAQHLEKLNAEVQRLEGGH